MVRTKNFRWIALGAFLVAIYVALGAFAAHGLRNHLTDSQLSTFQTALKYLFIHSFGLIMVNFIAHSTGKNCRFVNLFFVIGIIFFCFSLIIHALKDVFGFNFDFFALLAPFGGLSFIVGWVIFGIIALRT